LFRRPRGSITLGWLSSPWQCRAAQTRRPRTAIDFGVMRGAFPLPAVAHGVQNISLIRGFSHPDQLRAAETTLLGGDQSPTSVSRSNPRRTTPGPPRSEPSARFGHAV